MERSTCRLEILEVFRSLEQRRGREIFSLTEILAEMKSRGTSYPESTIRTHVCSHMCVDAPDNAAVTYPDLERVERGRYRRRLSSAATPTEVAFTVQGLPPKKDGANSMWCKDSEVERLVRLRLAAARAFGRHAPFKRELQVALVIHIGPENHSRIGSLENMVGGVLGGLQAAHPSTPWKDHSGWGRSDVVAVLPDRAIGLVDAGDVLAIDARKVVGDTEAPWYEVRLERAR